MKGVPGAGPGLWAGRTARRRRRRSRRPTTRRDRSGPPACARARGTANNSIQATADHRIAALREREGHQVTLSRRHVLSLAPATPCGFATAPLTCTLPFPIKRPGGPVSTETLQHVALFEKCRTFLPKAREVQAAGLHAWYKPISRSDRKSTRLNSSHGYISYAVFC